MPRTPCPAPPHPGLEELSRFLAGTLDRPAAHALVSHLVVCGNCRERIAPFGQMIFSPPAAVGSKYDFALHQFSAAFRRAVTQRELERAIASGTARPPSTQELLDAMLPPRELRGEDAWEHCEELLTVSWNLRHKDPEAMLTFALAAAALAEEIDPAACGSQQLADLQARAYAALGNARRVANDPLTAEADLLEARERAARGTGDRLFIARLMDLTASLYIAQRRFDEADQLLHWSYRLYLREGEQHRAGKALLQRALSAGYNAEPEAAAATLAGALRQLDPERDPEALLACVHTLIMVEIDRGHFNEARDIIFTARALYAEVGAALYDLKLTWLEGRIAAGLGHPSRAERWFKEAREGFLALNLPYTAAVAAMDLGVLLLQRRRTAEARALVVETLGTFHVLHIHRDAVTAVLLLREAIAQDALSITVLRSAAADLRKING